MQLTVVCQCDLVCSLFCSAFTFALCTSLLLQNCKFQWTFSRNLSNATLFIILKGFRAPEKEGLNRFRTRKRPNKGFYLNIHKLKEDALALLNFFKVSNESLLIKNLAMFFHKIVDNFLPILWSVRILWQTIKHTVRLYWDWTNVSNL